MKKSIAFLTLFILKSLLVAEVYYVPIPHYGDVEIRKTGDNVYTISLPHFGSYTFYGYYESDDDFELSLELPTEDLLGFVPVYGDYLELLGAKTTTYTFYPDGLHLHARVENGGSGLLREYVADALAVDPTFGALAEEVAGLLEISWMDMHAVARGDDIYGTLDGALSLAGIEVPFSEEGELSSDSLITALVVELPIAMGMMQLEIMKYGLTLVGGAIADGAEILYREAMEVGHDVSESVSHSYHDFDQCYNYCVPRYSTAQSGNFLAGANRFILDYYVQLAHSLNSVVGENQEETVAMRMELIGETWMSMEQELDARWNNIYHDDEVANYFFKDSSENAGLNRHKAIVQADWDHHRAYRAGIGANLLYNQDPLGSLSYWADQGEAVVMVHRNTNLSLDVQSAGTWNGVNVAFFENNGGTNQMWYLHKADEPHSYYIQSASSGQYLHISNAQDQAGSSMVCWQGRGELQTVFRAHVDVEGFVHWTTREGHAFDLATGIPENGKDLVIWDNHGGHNQQFTIFRAAIQPAIRPGEYFIGSYANNGSFFITAENLQENGANLYFETLGGWDTQRFQITGAQSIYGRQTYRLFSFGSGRFVHLEGANFGRGTNVLCWDGWGGENTRFFMDYDAHGQLRISNKEANVFEGSGDPHSIGSGTNLNVWNDKGEADMRWFLQPQLIY